MKIKYSKEFENNFNKKTLLLKNKISKAISGSPAPYVICALAEVTAMTVTYTRNPDVTSPDFINDFDSNLEKIQALIYELL